MDIKAFNQAKMLLENRRSITLEKLDSAKEKFAQNQEYAQLTKDIKLNTLALSKALANNQDFSEFEKKDKLLNKQLAEFENKFLNIKNFAHCPTCCDTGFVDGKYCNCFISLYKQVLRQKSGIDSLPNFTFKDNKIAEIKCRQSKTLAKLYDSMEKYCEEFPNNNFKNILICGKVGVGKSCLLSCTINKLLDKGISAQYFSAFNLNSLFLKYHTTNVKERDYILTNLIETDVLLIDDLGTEPIIKNVSIEYLTLLLTERQNKHTIIATNLTDEEIQNKYGDRVFSRLTNKNISKLLYLDGDDLRHINKK